MIDLLLIPFILLILFGFWVVDLNEKIDRLVETIAVRHQWLYRVEDRFLEFLSFSLHNGWFENFRIRYIKSLDDDADVAGEHYRVDFSYKLFKKDIEIPVANYYFYYEKGYKQRKEFIWPNSQDNQDPVDAQDLNYLEMLAKKLMTAILKTQLKKRLPA